MAKFKIGDPVVIVQSHLAYTTGTIYWGPHSDEYREVGRVIKMFQEEEKFLYLVEWSTDKLCLTSGVLRRDPYLYHENQLMIHPQVMRDDKLKEILEK